MAKEEIQISVVMVVRNPHPVFFPAAIQSVLNQNLPGVELIVVERRDERYGRTMLTEQQLCQIKYIETDGGSLIERRNIGLRSASGQYLAVMDADDICLPNRLRIQQSFLGANPDIAVVGSQVAVIDAENLIIGHRNFPTSHSDICAALEEQCPFSHPSVMMRKQFVIDVGGYHDFGFRTGEDYELWCRMQACGARLANLDQALLCYRLHTSQVKHSQIKDTLAMRSEVRRIHNLRSSRWTLRLKESVMRHLPAKLVYFLATRALYHDPPPADQHLQVGRSVPWIGGIGQNERGSTSHPAKFPDLAGALINDCKPVGG